MTEDVKEFVEQSPALQALIERVVKRRHEPVEDASRWPAFEQELHQRVAAVERELLAAEAARYDVEAERIEVGGQLYRKVLRSPASYQTAAGEVTIERNLFAPLTGGRALCPLELRLGIIEGYWFPLAARVATVAVAQMTPVAAEAFLQQQGTMRPSRASLDRLPKQLSSVWQAHRLQWEEALRAQETVPAEAVTLCLSLDGVMVPMRATAQTASEALDLRGRAEPAGYHEVGCGTVSLYDADGQRLETLRYGRMPEEHKATLKQQLTAEAGAILAARPDLTVVALADGARDNWNYLKQLWQQLCQCYPSLASVGVTLWWLVDFWHACQHLKKALEAYHGEGTRATREAFAALKTTLKEEVDGVERVIRALAYRRDHLQGQRRARLQTELTFFRRHRQQMRYAEACQAKLPIGSGVVEAACKTLVTQRLKQSGMRWGPAGGQAILTWRSLIQSGRFDQAWSLVSGSYRQPVSVVGPAQPVQLLKAA